MKTPVVTIETEAGPVRINRIDYDPAKHALAEKQDDDFEPFPSDAPNLTIDPPAPPTPVEPPAPPAVVEPPVVVSPPATPPAPPAPPAPPVVVEAFVTKNGEKWTLADAEGKSVDDVDYDTKKLATDALELRNKPATA